MKKILTKIIPSLLIVLFIGLLFGKTAWDSAKNDQVPSEDVAAADLPEYLNITGLQNGILYGMDKRASGGFRFCSYDASGQLYSHGFILAHYLSNQYCFAGEDNSTYYFPSCTNDDHDRLYSYSPTTPLRSKTLCKDPYSVWRISGIGTDFLYSKRRLQEKKYLEETVCLYDTETGNSKELISFRYDYENEKPDEVWEASVSGGGTYSNWDQTGKGEQLYWLSYADGLIYTYLMEDTPQEGTRYLLRSYNLDGSPYKIIDLTEVLSCLETISISRIKLDGDLLFYSNSNLQSLFIDISTETPQILRSDLEQEYNYQNISYDDESQPVSFYRIGHEGVVLLWNRDTKEFTECSALDWGIEGYINSIDIDKNGDAIISSTKTGAAQADNQTLYYFGTFSNGTLTNVHPLTESDLSFRPTTDE